MTDYTPTEMKKKLDAAKREGQRDMLEKVQEIIAKAEEEFPLEGDYEVDARHNYPDQQNMVYKELTQLAKEAGDE